MDNPKTDDGGRAERAAEAAAAKVKDTGVAVAHEAGKAAGVAVNVVEKAAGDVAKGFAGVFNKLTGKK